MVMGNQNSQFFQNLMQGKFRMANKPIFKTRPVWPPEGSTENEYRLGDNERYFIKCKVYVQGATLQYPNACIKISFFGHDGSAFTRLKSESDLRSMAAFLNDVADKLAGVMPTVREEEVKVKSALAAANSVMQADNMQFAGDGSESDTIQPLQ